MIRNLLIRLKRTILHKYDFVNFENLRLPLPSSRMCTEDFKNNKYYLSSSKEEVRKLIDHCHLSNESIILDIGCGSGRLPIGIISTIKTVRSYEGLDVNKVLIDWCKRNIKKYNSCFNFTYIDIYNERYNPTGNVKLNDNFKFPFSDENFDIIYLYSVFTHMLAEDIIAYLKDFKRILRPTGKIFLTAYLEENVPNVTVNPPNYRISCSGPLHRVRFNQKYFTSLVENIGFKIKMLNYSGEYDRQTGVYLVRL